MTDPIMKLFQNDLVEQSLTLSQGILALEKQCSAELLEELMRAAHSAKGAARVVRLEPIVRIAHEMEEVFVLLQNQELVFSEKLCDVLLFCTDLLEKITKIATDEVVGWVKSKESTFFKATDDIKAARSTTEDREEIKQEKSESVEQDLLALLPSSCNLPDIPQDLPEEVVETTKFDRFEEESKGELKIAAKSINRLMGLAGEALVESRRLTPFLEGLVEVRASIGHLQENLIAKTAVDRSDPFIHQTKERIAVFEERLASCISEMEVFFRRHINLSEKLYREVIASRMRPFVDGTAGFARLVRDVSRSLGKKIELVIKGEKTPVDREILEKLEAPLGHLLRNAIDHGIETPEERKKLGKDEEGQILLEAKHRGGMLFIMIQDDGRGLDVEGIREAVVKKGFLAPDTAQNLSSQEVLEFLFLPGFSTKHQVSDISGRGVGLDVLQSMVQEVGGSMNTVTEQGVGTIFTLRLPLTLSVIRALIVEVANEPYAFSLSRLDSVLHLEKEQIFTVQGKQVFQKDGENIGLIAASQVLGVQETRQSFQELSVVVLRDQQLGVFGVVVDRILGEKDLVVQELDPGLGDIANISAGAVMESGDPCLILDVDDMIHTIHQLLSTGTLQKTISRKRVDSLMKKVLVVDDSITVRQVETELLEQLGFVVDTAVDGADAWNLFRKKEYDLVVTDIDMPRMNGIELTRRIRSDPSYSHIPIVVVSYKDRSCDRQEALKAGANSYVSKTSFQDQGLIRAVESVMQKEGAADE